MSGFTDSALEKKLCELNQSQQSIQTLSLWLIHHRKHHKVIVQVWIRELNKAKTNRKLTFMYLANDVIQNSKKKGPEFSKEFSYVLSKAFAHVFECVSDDKTKKGLERIISVWEDRNVYDSKIIAGLRAAMKSAHRSSKAEKKGDKSETPSPSKKSRPQEIKSPKKSRTEKTKKRKATEKDSPKSPKRRSAPAPPKEEVAAPASPQGDPPEAEELIRAIQDLDNSPSTDAVVREKIAQFPPEVSDVTLLDKIQKNSVKNSVTFHSAVQGHQLRPCVWGAPPCPGGGRERGPDGVQPPPPLRAGGPQEAGADAARLHAGTEGAAAGRGEEARGVPRSAAAGVAGAFGAEVPPAEPARPHPPALGDRGPGPPPLRRRPLPVTPP